MGVKPKIALVFADNSKVYNYVNFIASVLYDINNTTAYSVYSTETGTRYGYLLSSAQSLSEVGSHTETTVTFAGSGVYQTNVEYTLITMA